MFNIFRLIALTAVFLSSLAQADVLQVGQELRPDQPLYSDDRSSYLVLQGSDGNLVLYSAAGNPIWATYRYGGKKLVVQVDRNLVVYDGNDRPVWSSRTNKNVVDNATLLRVHPKGLELVTGSSILWKAGTLPCTTPTLFLACAYPGTNWQFPTNVSACTTVEAESSLFSLYGHNAQLGMCPNIGN
jgi:hypothetical protein